MKLSNWEFLFYSLFLIAVGIIICLVSLLLWLYKSVVKIIKKIKPLLETLEEVNKMKGGNFPFAGFPPFGKKKLNK